jgi:lysophospholipase L1-like esterase
MSLRFSRSSLLVVSLLAGACSSSADGGHDDAGVHPSTDAGAHTSPDSAAPDAAHAHDATSKDAHSGGDASDGGSVDAARDQSAPHEAGDAALDVATPPADAANDSDGATPDGPAPDAHTDSASGSPPTDATSGTPPSPALRYVGRIELSDPAGPQFEWPGTEVIARFDGTGITLNMTDYGNYFDVIVDGTVQPTPIIGLAGTTAYTLVSGLLYRRTEAYVSTTQILGQTVIGGSLLPPGQAASRRIEVIGDSISCGYGALGVGPMCDPTDANEDHDVTYEAVAGRALGADVITTAWSGEGVYENYGGSMTSTLPDLYPYTLPNEPGTGTLWDFTSWIPDAVVIDLGTNDFSNGDPGSGYETAYLALLRTVRGHYPNAYILCANGPLLTNPDFTTAEAYINGAITQMGDPKVAYLSFGIQSGADGYGCDYHPNVATHAEMALTLEQALQAALGW